MSQQQQIGRVATTIRTVDGYTEVVYHKTAVVKFNEDKIILNHGGWMTATTKTRMNQASNQFGLGFQVYSRDFNWYASFNGSDREIPFEDGIVILKRKS
jgi:hypothetical protein